MALSPTDGDIKPKTTRTYEVQRHSAGRWMVDSVSDDKDVALELAKALMGGRRPPSGVRVMAVELKESGKFSEISIFRSTMVDQGRDEMAAPKPKIEAKPKGSSEIRDFKQSSKPTQTKRRSALANVLRNVQIAVALGLTFAVIEAVRLLMR